MTDNFLNDIFLRACRCEDVEYTPIWIMRQAGRYLPEYRAIRARTDFLSLCRSPELSAEVSIQPVQILDVDACIIFSDILVLPQAMGMELFIEGNSGGPRFASPIRSHLDIEKLAVPDPNVDLKYVMDAICLTRKNLNGRVPLIGFAGSPWTLAAYMVEGKGSKDFETIKGLIRSDPEELHTLLDKLARAAALYLNAMIDAGAQALQIFDTWGGILQKNEFHEFSLRYIAQVLGLLESVDVPIIVYCKNCGHSVGAIANAGCDVVGLDQSVDISAARKEAGSRKALQGNMDPAVLLSSAEHIREEVKKILEKFGSGNGHIFNLGHGILPDTPVDNVRALVQAVKEESVRYHL